MLFSGVCTALVTPFTSDNKIDYVALKKLVQVQVDAKVSAILILGSTGESSTVCEDERRVIIPFVKNLLPKQIKLIVGTSSNDTKKCINQCNEASYLGADACLISSPYYNKCTQEGVFLYFKKITENTNVPIVVYNVPSRTGVNISPKTMQKISSLKNICGLKEANGNIDHILEMFHSVNIPIYSGNDNLNYIFLKYGAKGIISVTSNAYPKQFVEFFKNKDKHKILEQKFYNFNKLMFIEPNPIPIKYVLMKQRLIKNILRSPLTKLEEKHCKMINAEIEKIKEQL